MVLVHQMGLANPKRPDARTEEGKAVQAKEPVRPFWPNYMVDELVAWYVLLAVLVVLASLFPAGLEDPANPLQTPNHVKPEWYFLGVYQMLKLVPRIVGILVPIVGVGTLLVWPFLDHNPEVLARRRKFAVGGATLILVALIVLTVVGYVS